MNDLNEIIKECQKNNRNSQKELYEKFVSKFIAIGIRYCGNINDAQDVVHNAFLKIFSEISSLKKLDSFEYWGKKIVINECLKQIKSQSKFSLWNPKNELEENLSEVDDIEEWYLEISTSDLFEKITQMPPSYRLVFNMFYIEKMKHNEIADTLEINIGTSKSHLFKAKKWLRKEFISKNNTIIK